MKLLELELFRFAPEGCPVFDYAVSLSRRGSVYIGAIENITEGRFVQIDGRDTYMTDSWSDGLQWFWDATKAKA